MFLHVGNNKNIRERDIIGIFDMDNATVSTVTRKFLSEAQKKNTVESANNEIPKSFVIYREGDKINICFSQLSSAALYGRLS
ncbi:MAG: DUF370 domain-containing protein [Clostridia bacterium]|nr:DUF370 domain-containing protein [Clostridia bacterium]